MTTNAINTKTGFIPISRIVRILPDKHRVEYLDGHGQVVITESIKELDGTEFLPVVPAIPGYEILDFVAEPEADWGYAIEHAPVIAWHIDGQNARPISLDDMATRKGAGILTPDGQVFGPESGAVACSKTLWVQLQAAAADLNLADYDP
ncbi:hypothetical protein LRD18_10505 [Halorhodospira halochloris]|uniref:hypothetical protein n=1 Tax=Halorhodospira halochloris TaxID=1052 RepID=UPI001EE8B7F4|nr:hypothetical protein [Halorhodospira halochloris]MCG5531286.1 hypothetical protein [Halorhodospira halochloris]